jgi:hypothetical protein
MISRMPSYFDRLDGQKPLGVVPALAALIIDWKSCVSAGK